MKFTPLNRTVSSSRIPTVRLRTGGWQQWQSVATTLWLDAGVHRLRVITGQPELTIKAEDFDFGGARES